MGDADSDAKKQALFEKVRNGSVRVLIGSTQKMGTGTNVQKRLVALHHLDAPWKPAEVEQREGRILRQGNENAEVAIYRYVTEGSFDAYMWQALETKARFIAQVMTGESAVRRAEDIGGQELSYAEVKAIASGNPAVLTLAEADAELQRLAILKKNYADEQFLARKNVRDLPGAIDRLSNRVRDLAADRATAKAHADDPLVVGERSCNHQDEVMMLGKRLKSLPGKVSTPTHVPLGRYRGLTFGIIVNPFSAPEAFLEGTVRRHERLSRESHGPGAVLGALDRLVGTYEAEQVRTERDLELAQNQLRDYETRLGATFGHEAYLSELTQLRDQLKLRLSDAAQQPGTDSLPPADELAERIKALKAGNTIEAAPERLSGRRVARGEEPVTGRIRKRTAAVCAPQLQTEAIAPPEAAEEPAAPPSAASVIPPLPAEDIPSPASTEPTAPAAESPPGLARPEPAVLRIHATRPVPAYREHVARGRRTDARQLSLF